MAKEKGSYLKLGIFIVVGLVIFLGVVYYLANQRHLFQPTIELYATFNTVSGLQVGNNVRFTGINIGTVESINIVSDTSVTVTMRIEEKASDFIKKDAVAVVASVGLMGNKFINISQGSATAPRIEDGDILVTRPPIEIEDVLQVLRETGSNTSKLTANLVELSEQVNQGVGVVGKLLTDTVLASEVEQSIHDLKRVNAVIEEFRMTGVHAREMAGDMSIIMERIRKGQGLIGRLTTDSTWVHQFEAVLDTLETIGGKTSLLADDLNVITQRIMAGEGTAGRLLSDTTTASNIDATLNEMEQAAKELQETMKQLQRGWLFRFIGGSNKKD